jgi:UDP:flavonoid glycosyltransferase YjiC (YdhE family)
MRFVLTPIGSSGDVHPFVGIGRALRARGHDVVVVTGGPFEDVVCRAGLGFLGMFSTEEYEAATNHPDLWHARRGLRIVMQLVASRLEFAYARLKEVYEPGRTVLVGHSLSFVTRLLEEKERVPAATLHLAPSVFCSDFEQPAYAPGRTATGAPRWVKRAIWWAVDRLLIDPSISGPLNRFRNELGLPPVRRPFRHWIHSPQRVIGLFPEWFAPPQQDWPASLRLTGFPQYDESDQQGLSPKLQEFLDEGSAPIVFTPGSANQQAAAFFKAAVDASSRLKRRAVLDDLLFRVSADPALKQSDRGDPGSAGMEHFWRVLVSDAADGEHGNPDGRGNVAQGADADRRLSWCFENRAEDHKVGAAALGAYGFFRRVRRASQHAHERTNTFDWQAIGRQVYAIDLCGDRDVKPVIHKNLRCSPCSRVAYPADQLVEIPGIEVFFADLNQVDAVADRGTDEGKNVPLPPVGDVAADHSAVRPEALSDRTRCRSSEMPMRMSMPPRAVTPPRKTLCRMTGRNAGT